MDKFEEYDILHSDADESVKYRIIGIGIDGSKNSHQAVVWAIKNIVRVDNDLIILIHVRSETEYSLEFENSIQRDSEKVLKAEIDYLKSHDKKIAIKAISVVGDSRDEICAVAKAFNTDLLIVGSRGNGTVKR